MGRWNSFLSLYHELKIVVDRKRKKSEGKIGKAQKDFNKLIGNIKSIGSAMNLQSFQKGHLDPSLRKIKVYSH